MIYNIKYQDWPDQYKGFPLFYLFAGQSKPWLCISELFSCIEQLNCVTTLYKSDIIYSTKYKLTQFYNCNHSEISQSVFRKCQHISRSKSLKYSFLYVTPKFTTLFSTPLPTTFEYNYTFFIVCDEDAYPVKAEVYILHCRGSVEL